MSKILIADNELALAAKLESFLLEKGYDVVGIAVSGCQAVNMTLSLNPDLVLMEIKLTGDLQGIAAAQKIRAARDIPIVFLTWYGDEKSLSRVARVHPEGYVLKPFQRSQVLAAIQVALDNSHRFRKRKAADSEMAPLQTLSDNNTVMPQTTFTPAENKVAGLIKQGMRTREIALRLKLAPSTIDLHRKNIRKKMGIAGNNTRNLMGSLSFLDSHIPPLKA
ncbi:MAG TPA: DNA-binding response regulator [Desulfobacteria bacterium]|nr:DNA-binding response regulator [Desulfobacteria bacterium]